MCQILSIKQITLAIDSHCVNKESYEFVYYQKRLFPMELPAKWLINVSKVLPLRLQQCFDPYSILSVWGSSETRLFRQLSNRIFRSRDSRKTSAMRVILFWKMFKIYYRFGKCKKKTNWDKVFCFWDNCIWIRSAKLSLLGR